MVRQRAEIIKDLHRLFRLVQRQNRFISRAPNSTDLSLLETHALIEVDSNPEITLGELAVILNFDQGNISRTSRSLERRGYLKSIVQGRRRTLFVTSKSEKALRAIDDYADSQIARSMEALSRTQQHSVQKLYEALSEGSGAPKNKPRPFEHPLRAPQRRITRAFGLLGSSAFGSGLSPTTYQVLAFLADSASAVASKAISEILLVKPSNLSIILSGFQHEKLLTKATDIEDRRHSRISLSEKGRKYFSQAEQAACSQLAAALSSIRTAELGKWLDALSMYVDAGAEDVRVVLRQIMGEHIEARAFIVQNLVRLGHEALTPPSICAQDSITYVAHTEETIIAAVHFRRTGEASSLLDCITWAPDLDRSSILFAILENAVSDQQQYFSKVDTSKTSSFLPAISTSKRPQVLLLKLPIKRDEE